MCILPNLSVITTVDHYKLSCFHLKSICYVITIGTGPHQHLNCKRTTLLYQKYWKITVVIMSSVSKRIKMTSNYLFSLLKRSRMTVLITCFSVSKRFKMTSNYLFCIKKNKNYSEINYRFSVSKRIKMHVLITFSFIKRNQNNCSNYIFLYQKEYLWLV